MKNKTISFKLLLKKINLLTLSNDGQQAVQGGVTLQSRCLTCTDCPPFTHTPDCPVSFPPMCP